MIYKYLPYRFNKYLFGDRQKYGTEIVEDDPEWCAFQDYSEKWHEYYKNSRIRQYVDRLGYKVLKELDVNEKIVLEIGAGLLPHLEFLNGKPKRYIVVDIRNHFLDLAKNQIGENCETHLSLNRSTFPDVAPNSVDFIFTFYSLEHLPNLEETLTFYYKVLKKGGSLVGAIPNEGGMIWGLGRSLTTYRAMNKKGFNYNKVICWEHVNFCDHIIHKIETVGFTNKSLNFLPFTKIKNRDVNLVSSFIYKK